MITIEKSIRRVMIAVTIIGMLLGQISIPFLGMIAIISSGIILVFDDEVHSFYMALFLVPSIRIFDRIGVSFIVNILMLLPFLKLLVERKSVDKTSVILAIILCALETINGLLIYGDTAFDYFADISAIITLVYCVTITVQNPNLNQRDAAYFLGGGALTSFFIYFISHPDTIMKMVTNIDTSHYFKCYAGDPNFFSWYMCMSLALFLVEPRYTRAFDYVFVVLITIISLISASKMALVLVAFTYLYVIIYYFNNVTLKREKRVISRLMIILSILAVIFNKRILLFFNYMIKRSGYNADGFDMYVLTSGRNQIVSSYFNALLDNINGLLFGFGLQYHLHLGFYDSSITHCSHNTFLDIVLAWGIIGLIIMGIIIVYWYKSITNKHGLSGKAISYMPFYVMGISFFSLSCLSGSMFWLVITAAMLCVKNSENS